MSGVSDKEFYHLTISINKALNPMEAPLKLKHVRSAIITTHRTREAKSFWAVIMRQPLMENRFTAWKFCHLLHKVLREGHESAIKHSQTHKKMIFEMGKLWGHLHDGVGNCIQAYSKLLVTKLDFHEKNLLFPGSLIIDFRDVEKYAGDDINVYFQLCVEIFDYLDDIIDVQAGVFASINTYRMSSMTPQGQCRLAPLITLIQDSNPLYDLGVRIMFKLHDNLPNDILSGHRNRFQEMFVKLKFFYDNVRPLQYFADLIQVPHLPEVAPNFTSKVDFGSYIPPVVFVQPEPEPIMANLVDTSIIQKQEIDQSSSMPSNEIIELENKIHDQELTIRQLHNEITTIKSSFSAVEGSYKSEISQLTSRVQSLGADLMATQEMCTQLQSTNEDLKTKLDSTPNILQKANEEEERARASEEKFSKLKVMYTQMRDEHINLLRQNGESTKQMQRENQELRNQICALEEIAKDKDSVCAEKTLLQQKLEEATINFKTLSVSHEDLKQSHEKFKTSEDIGKEHMKSTLQQLEREVIELRDFKFKCENLESLLEDANKSIRVAKDEQVTSQSTFATTLESERIAAADQKRILEMEINSQVTQQNELQKHIAAVKDQLKENETRLAKLHEEKILADNKQQDLEQQHAALEIKYKKAVEDTHAMVAAKRESDKSSALILEALIRSIFGTINEITTSKCNELNQPSFEKTFGFLQEFDRSLNKFTAVYQKHSKENNASDFLAKNAILLGYNFTMLHEQCSIIYNTTTDIEKGQDLFNQVNQLCQPMLKLYKTAQNMEDSREVEKSVGDITTRLSSMTELITTLMQVFDTNIDLGDLVEKELEDMSKSIEEAASRFVEMLSSARSRDNGIKLEVNEKILDACTSLMECIKRLIQKSKVLQEEIVSNRKGVTTVKEFYKRNSQWTEGLISASKSVAKGANLLVEAANKAVTSESNKNFEIIVAAQEIAACTAQLVIASKVKAPRDSQKLVDLTKASRSVSQATGVIIATVKDCNHHLEQMQDVDLSKLTSSQAKTMEIEIHVKVLELEQALQLERLKLSAFRRNNYQNTEE